ncbi:hypothetical protein Esti_001862 [Eimeria stiedai]
MLGCRFAEGGGHEVDDQTPRSTPELVELSLGLEQDFTHKEFYSETRVSSPIITQSFLHFLETDEGPHTKESTGPFQRILEGSEEDSVAGSSAKRPASQGSEDDDKTSGSSRKVAGREAPSVDAQNPLAPQPEEVARILLLDFPHYSLA